MIFDATNKKHKRKKFTVKKYRWSNCNEQCEEEMKTNDKPIHILIYIYINVLKGCQRTALAKKKGQALSKTIQRIFVSVF